MSLLLRLLSLSLSLFSLRYSQLCPSILISTVLPGSSRIIISLHLSLSLFLSRARARARVHARTHARPCSSRPTYSFYLSRLIDLNPCRLVVLLLLRELFYKWSSSYLDTFGCQVAPRWRPSTAPTEKRVKPCRSVGGGISPLL